MLVYSRKRDESLVIGDEIVVTVVDIRGDKVRLGIDCPEELSVYRGEVLEAIRQHERSQADAQTAPAAAPAETVTLSGRHTGLLDQLGKARGLSRHQVLEAALDALEKAGVRSLAELQSALRNAAKTP